MRFSPREARRKVDNIMDEAKKMMEEANELYSEGIRRYSAQSVGFEIILKCSLQALMSIGNSLIEIRDELKDKAEDVPKLKWTEKPWGLLCPNCGHPALNYPNGKDAHSPYCPWCGSEMEVDKNGNT